MLASNPAKRILFTGLIAFIANHFFEFLVIFLGDSPQYLLCSYDCSGWYFSIIEDGYMLEPSKHARGDAANWAFFPLFPMLAKGVQIVTGRSSEAALVITGKLFWFPAILSFLTLQARYRPETPLWIAAILVALNPVSIYGNTGYTEPLFLLLSSLAMLQILNGNPVRAGMFGALLTATRAVGIGVGLVYAHYAIMQLVKNRGKKFGRVLFGGLLIPLGLAGYMMFLHWHVGDALAFSHILKAWGREISNPLEVLVHGFKGSAYAKTMSGVATIALVASAYLAWKRDFGMALFLAFCTLIPLSTGLMSLQRYALFQAPMILVVGTWISLSRWFYPILVLSIIGYLFMIMAWQEAQFFVI